MRLLVGVTAWALGALACAAADFPVEIETGGCRLERLAGGDRSYHQFHGASPDGRWLAIGWETGEGPAAVRGAFLLNLVTGERQALPLNNAASFSPDGDRLVSGFHSGSRLLRTEIVEYDLETQQLRLLAPDAQADWLPSWAPDGRSVLFNSFRSGGSDMYQVDAATGATTRLSDDPRYEAHGQWSPDGSSILFHRQVGEADYDILRLTPADGAVVALASTPREESYPALAPDGALIAFSSDRAAETGKNDIYLMRPDGEVVRRLTAGPGNDAYASWSPDGRWLYFNAERDGGTAVYRMEIVAGDCRRA